MAVALTPNYKDTSCGTLLHTSLSAASTPTTRSYAVEVEGQADEHDEPAAECPAMLPRTAANNQEL